jgi:hypothetical protein
LFWNAGPTGVGRKEPMNPRMPPPPPLPPPEEDEPPPLPLFEDPPPLLALGSLMVMLTVDVALVEVPSFTAKVNESVPT